MANAKDQSVSGPVGPVHIVIGCMVVAVAAGIFLLVACRLISSVSVTAFITRVVSYTGFYRKSSNLQVVRQKDGWLVEIGGRTMPDGFPVTFPVYPEARVTSVLTGAAPATKGYWLSMTVPAPYDDVRRFYMFRLRMGRWRVVDEFMTQNGLTSYGFRDDTFEGTVLIRNGSEGKATDVFVGLSPFTVRGSDPSVR